jgi:hypothetical protein
VVTQDRAFDPLRYAAAQSGLMIKELDDITPLKKVVFIPPLRRRDGDGSVSESTVLAAYTIATESHEFTAIVATVSAAVSQLFLFTYVSCSSAAPHPLRLESALTTRSKVARGLHIHDPVAPPRGGRTRRDEIHPRLRGVVLQDPRRDPRL